MNALLRFVFCFFSLKSPMTKGNFPFPFFCRRCRCRWSSFFALVQQWFFPICCALHVQSLALFLTSNFQCNFMYGQCFGHWNWKDNAQVAFYSYLWKQNGQMRMNKWYSSNFHKYAVRTNEKELEIQIELSSRIHWIEGRNAVHMDWII